MYPVFRFLCFFSACIIASFLFQALEVIKQLKESIPIARAQMRIRLSVPREFSKKIRDKLVQFAETVEAEEWDMGALDLVRQFFDAVSIQL